MQPCDAAPYLTVSLPQLSCLHLSGWSNPLTCRMLMGSM
jgi:hypothetical protein